MFEHKKLKNTIIIYLKGRLDIQMSLDAEVAINEILTKYETCDVLLNLKKLEYISSSGLRILVALFRQLSEKERTLKLCSLNDSVHKTLEIVELLDMFNIYSDESEAIA